MLRTQISLTEQERRVLDEVSARTGRSIAALIRDAVDSVYGDERSVEDDLATMRSAAGAWGPRAPSGADWVGQVRSGRRLEDVR